jgi:hypothetical protein
MNSEERFKKSLEELIQSKEFPFDEDNWHRASAMIDASKNVKNRIVPFVLGSALLLISVLGGFYMLNNTSAPISVKLSSKQESNLNTISNAIPESKSAQPLIQVTAQPTEVKKTLRVLNTPVTKTDAAKIDQPVSPETPTIKHTPEVTANNDTKTPAAGPVANVENVKGNDQTGNSADALTPTKNTNSTETNNTALNPVSQDNTVKSEEPVKSNNDIVKENTNEPPVNENSSSLIAQIPGSVPVQNTSTETRQETHIPAENVAAVTSLPSNSGSLSSQTESKTEETMPQLVNTPLVSNQESLKDSIAISTDIDDVNRPTYVTPLFSIEGGASYSFGWKNPANRDANGFNLVLGINYFNHFNNKFAVSVGLQYTSIGNLNFSSHTSRITRLSLGEESKVTVITPSKIHYLVAPIRLNYNINPMNTIGIGCNVAYLLTVDSDVETYEEKFNSTFDHELTRERGYTDGFSTFDTQVSAFYKRRLYPNLSVNTEVFYGLTDVKNNKFFNLNTFERNCGIKLTLVYNILKH